MVSSSANYNIKHLIPELLLLDFLIHIPPPPPPLPQSTKWRKTLSEGYVSLFLHMHKMWRRKMKVTSYATHSSRSSTCVDFQNDFLQCESNHQPLDPSASTEWSKTLSEVLCVSVLPSEAQSPTDFFHTHKWLLPNSSRDQRTFDCRKWLVTS